MKKFTKFCITAGVIFSILGGSAMAAGAVGGGWKEVSGAGAMEVSSWSSSESLTLDAQTYSFLEFQLSDENIVLRPSQDGNIHIRYTDHAHVRYHTRTEAPTESGTGGTFVFTRMELDSGFHFGFTFRNEEQILVSLPKGVGVSISTVSGDMELENLDLQSLTISTSSGDSDMDHLTVAGDLMVSSISGDQELENIAVSGSTHLESTSGEIDLQGCQLTGTSLYSVSGDLSGSAQISGDITLDTTSGDVKLDLRGSPAHRRGTVSTVSGDVQLEGLVEDAAYAIDIETVSGDVDIKQ